MVLSDLVHVSEPFNNGVINKGNLLFETAHRFWREAILDRHIPLTKIVGFKVQHTGMSNEHIAYRDTGYRESYITLCNYINNIIVLDFEAAATIGKQFMRKCTMEGAENAYSLNIDEARVKVSHVPGKITDQYYSVISTDETILTSTKATVRDTPRIDLLVRTGVGYYSLDALARDARNSGKIELDRYFPVGAYYSLNDFVRILPPTGDNEVHYRLYNGMTDDIMNQFVNLWLKLFESESLIIGGESVWLESISVR